MISLDGLRFSNNTENYAAVFKKIRGWLDSIVMYVLQLVKKKKELPVLRGFLGMSNLNFLLI